MLEIELAGAPTTSAALSKLERTLGLVLPKSYRKFLLSWNGGRPKTPLFPIVGMPLNPFGGVHFFFGIEPGSETSDIEGNYALFKGKIPDAILPIADNGGGDYLCIDLRNNQERVMFWDHRPFWGTGEWNEQDLYFVAGSFEKFLESLRPRPY